MILFFSPLIFLIDPTALSFPASRCSRDPLVFLIDSMMTSFSLSCCTKDNWPFSLTQCWYPFPFVAEAECHWHVYSSNRSNRVIITKWIGVSWILVQAKLSKKQQPDYRDTWYKLPAQGSIDFLYNSLIYQNSKEITTYKDVKSAVCPVHRQRKWKRRAKCGERWRVYHLSDLHKLLCNDKASWNKVTMMTVGHSEDL